MPTYEPEVLRFIEHVAVVARKHNVAFEFVPQEHVQYLTGSKVNGYFSDRPPTLAVAIDKLPELWLPVLVHESSHMDQFLEHASAWIDGFVPGTTFETEDIIFMWVDGKIELTDQQLREYIRRSRELELDCEKRAAQKIREFNLPLNVGDYIRSANAYVWFWTMIATTRKWYLPGREPYRSPIILAHMPEHFENDYSVVPDKVIPLFLDLTKE